MPRKNTSFGDRTTAIFKNPFEHVAGDKKQLPPWQVVPPWFPGSNAEWAIYWALTSILGSPQKGDWDYQANLVGGRALLGGAVADFYIPWMKLVIRVQGVHWHYGLGEAKIQMDEIQKANLISAGYEVVDIDSDMALANPIYYTKEALRGLDHSRAAKGL